MSADEAVEMLWALRRAQQVFWSEISTRLAQAGLGDLTVRRIWVLEAIAEGSQSPSALAERLAVSRQVITQNVDTLVERGYVERTPSEKDRRRVTLELSTQGSRAVTIARRATARVHDRLRRDLGDHKAAELTDSLTALRDASGTPSLPHRSRLTQTNGASGPGQSGGRRKDAWSVNAPRSSSDDTRRGDQSG